MLFENWNLKKHQNVIKMYQYYGRWPFIFRRCFCQKLQNNLDKQKLSSTIAVFYEAARIILWLRVILKRNCVRLFWLECEKLPLAAALTGSRGVGIDGGPTHSRADTHV